MYIWQITFRLRENDEALELLMAFNDGFRTSLRMVNPLPFAPPGKHLEKGKLKIDGIRLWWRER
jgi:hypothetical protein